MFSEQLMVLEMPLKDYVISPQAQENLEDIFSNVAFYTYSYQSAEKLFDELFGVFELLALFPTMGIEGNVIGTREFYKRGYRIVYEIQCEQVIILAVLHCKRKYP